MPSSNVNDCATCGQTCTASFMHWLSPCWCRKLAIISILQPAGGMNSSPCVCHVHMLQLGALARLVVYDLHVYQLQLIPMMLEGDPAWRSMSLLWHDPGDIMKHQSYHSVVAPLKCILKQEGIKKAVVGHLGESHTMRSIAHLAAGHCSHAVHRHLLMGMAISMHGTLQDSYME